MLGERPLPRRARGSFRRGTAKASKRGPVSVSEHVLNALLCCERVITEHNGKKGLIGVFTQFNFPRVPAANLPWFVYAWVANLSAGSHTFTLNLVHDNTQAVVLSVGGDVEVKEVGVDVDLAVPVGSVIFPKFGAYSLTFNVDMDQVGSRVLRVTERREGDGS